MRRRRNHDFGELPYDVPIPASAVMFNRDGSVTLETAGEPPVINRGRRRNQYHDPDAKREAMLRELSGHLADLVAAGEMSDQEANEWYNMKADQWARGLNRGRRRNAGDFTPITSPGELSYSEAHHLLSLLHHLGIDGELGRDGEVVAVPESSWRKASHFYRQAVIDGLVKQQTASNRGRRRNASSIVSEIHRQLIHAGLNPRLDYVAWDENTLKVSKGQNGALIHYDRGRDLYDITEYHGFKQKHLGSGYQIEELYDAVMPTLTPRHGF